MWYYCSDSQIHRGPRPFQHFIKSPSYNLSVSYSYLLPELTRAGLTQLARPQNESRLHLYFYQLALRVLGKLYYFKCMRASPAYMSAYLMFAWCQRNQKESELLELELHMVASRYVVLRLKPRYSGRAASALRC